MPPSRQQLLKFLKRRTKKTFKSSQAYHGLRRRHYYLTPNFMMLKKASWRCGQNLEIGTVVIYRETRPVKILAGFSSSFVYVQFLDRIDTPVARVDSKQLYSGIPYSGIPSEDELVMEEAFGDFLEQAEQEPTNAFEEGWW